MPNRGPVTRRTSGSWQWRAAFLARSFLSDMGRLDVATGLRGEIAGLGTSLRGARLPRPHYAGCPVSAPPPPRRPLGSTLQAKAPYRAAMTMQAHDGRPATSSEHHQSLVTAWAEPFGTSCAGTAGTTPGAHVGCSKRDKRWNRAKSPATTLTVLHEQKDITSSRSCPRMHPDCRCQSCDREHVISRQPPPKAAAPEANTPVTVTPPPVLGQPWAKAQRCGVRSWHPCEQIQL